MKETRFISQNKEKWQEAEKLLESPAKDPEKLSSLFVQVVDDLSYSRTYYPNRSVRVYLNKIARQFFSIIYSHKKGKKQWFQQFWKDELPQVIFYCRKELLVAFLFFMTAVAIGMLSSAKDPQFVNTILGEDYVAMTEKNIANGDPMAVYKQSHQVNMFLGITFNNLMVAFRTYVLGIFFCLGTLGSLLTNGIMVGCFQYYFLERGLFVESASAIWLHGTLEISSIILAGGAGLTLGRGLIFPGTYSRLQSLQISGVRSMKLMLGITPIFVLAAIIESFLTRYTDTPTFLRILLILLSAAFIIGYFVVYPWLKSRSGFEAPLPETKLQPTDREAVNFSKIKTNADILKDAFQFYSRHSAAFLPWIAAVAAGVALFNIITEPELSRIPITFEFWWVSFFSEMFEPANTKSIAAIFVNSVATTIVLYRVMKLVDVDAKAKPFSFSLKASINIFLLTILLYGCIYFDWFGSLVALALFGLLLVVAFAQLNEKAGIFRGFSKGWSLFGKNKNQGIGLQLILILLSFSFLLILNAPLHYIHMNVIQWNFSSADYWSQKLIHFFELFIKTASFYLILPLVTASFSYLYFSQMEVVTASGLLQSIKKMGARITKSSR